MKFICLGYADKSQFEKMPKDELNRSMEECFAYDDVLRRQGHFVGGMALAGKKQSATLQYVNGKLKVLDGPFIETKEQIGGILILEAEDIEEAISLMSKHPGIKFGPFEIRPIDEEMTKTIEARNKAIARSK